MSQHTPIMVAEFLSFFEGKTLETFVDGTIGAGGHAAALLAAHPEVKLFIGLDQDPGALQLAEEELAPFKTTVRLIQSNFRHLGSHVVVADGIFLDIGVSSMQLDQPERGFSLYKEGPLDMRMDPGSRLTAAEVVNKFSERKIGEILRDYGEEPRWKRTAKAIVEGRSEGYYKTTEDLNRILKPVLTWGGRRGKKIHPFTLVYQALRIYVNDELGALEEGLDCAIDRLSPGGRLGVITFHRLEDRVVKQRFRSDPRVEVLTKKPLEASEEEVKANPRARSAKLRFVEKR